MHKHGRVDLNQAEIRDAARSAGASWVSLADIGGGCPDAIVGAHGRTWLLEIKQPKGTLTPDQVKFMASWRGEKVYVVRTVADMLKLLQVG